jgi:hypothetical protein
LGMRIFVVSSLAPSCRMTSQRKQRTQQTLSLCYPESRGNILASMAAQLEEKDMEQKKIKKPKQNRKQEMRTSNVG